MASFLYLAIFSLSQWCGGGCKFVILSHNLTIQISTGSFLILSRLSFIFSCLDGNSAFLDKANTPLATAVPNSSTISS